MSESEPEDLVHISSAVVRAHPTCAAAVVEAIGRLPAVEVFHAEGGKIIVVLEGPTSAALAATLAEINLIEGVVTTSLVYEHIEPRSFLGEFHDA
jgi:periplasmic nitrate reductase NapD